MGTTWLNITTQIDQILTNQKIQFGHDLQIIGLLIDLQNKEKKAMDVLDSVVAQLAQVQADLTTEGAEITNIIMVLQGLQTGSIAVTDPRFQQAINSLTSLDSTIKSATSAMDAVAPPPITP